MTGLLHGQVCALVQRGGLFWMLFQHPAVLLSRYLLKRALCNPTEEAVIFRLSHEFTAFSTSKASSEFHAIILRIQNLTDQNPPPSASTLVSLSPCSLDFSLSTLRQDLQPLSRHQLHDLWHLRFRRYLIDQICIHHRNVLSHLRKLEIKHATSSTEHAISGRL